MNIMISRACDRCHKSKLTCDKQGTCGRCAKAKVQCTYDRPSRAAGRPKTRPTMKPKYSHTACLNCKKRKKKCDEAWPRCSGCVYLGMECPGPATAYKFDVRGQKSNESSSNLSSTLSSNSNLSSNLSGMSSSLSSGVTSGLSSGVSGLNQLNKNLQQNLEKPMSPHIPEDLLMFSPHLSEFLAPQSSINVLDLTNELFNDETNFLSNKERFLLNSLVKSPTFPVEFEDDYGGQGQGQGQGQGIQGNGNGQDGQGNGRNGQINCRNGSGNGGVNGSNGLNGRGYGSDFALDVSPASVMSSEYAEVFEEEKSALISSCSLGVYNIPEKELDLLKYFITDVSSLLFVDKTSTIFLKTVVPLCMADSNVRFPVLGISAAHRSNAMGDVGIGYKREAAIYRAKSQSLFIANTVNLFEDSENLLLSILLLAVQEIFEGTSLYWGFALERAAEIIGKRGGLKMVSLFAPLSVQLFCYLDLISSLSTCSSPYVHKSEFGDYDEDHIENILNNKFGFKFGIAGEIFKIIGNISTLASLRTSRYDSQENEKKFNSLATLIEMRLQNWSPSLDGKKYQIDNSMDNGRLVLSKFTVALQWSAFLRLHQIRNGYNRKDQRVEACLSLLLSSMKEIQHNSDLETGLMFPLIMAGSVAYKVDDREYILSRIRRIKSRLKLNYVGEFEKLILSVWSRDGEEGHQVNWAKIRYFEFPGLVMF